MDRSNEALESKSLEVQSLHTQLRALTDKYNAAIETDDAIRQQIAQQ